MYKNVYIKSDREYIDTSVDTYSKSIEDKPCVSGSYTHDIGRGMDREGQLRMALGIGYNHSIFFLCYHCLSHYPLVLSVN